MSDHSDQDERPLAGEDGHRDAPQSLLDASQEHFYFFPNLRSGLFGINVIPRIKTFDRNHLDLEHMNKYEPQNGGREFGRYVQKAVLDVFAPDSAYKKPVFMLQENSESNEVSISKYSTKKQFKTAGRIFFGYESIHQYATDKDTKDNKKTIFFLKASYFLLLGWAFAPLMNIIKLVTEFPLKLLAELSAWAKDSLMSRFAILNLILCFIPAVLQFTFEVAHVIMRMLVSPVESAKAGFNSGYGEAFSNFLGVFSIVGSAALWTALVFAAGPLLAFIAPKLGISLAPAAHSGFLTSISSPVLDFLTTQLHFALTPALTAAVAVSTAILAPLGLNETVKMVREGLMAWTSKPKGYEALEDEYVASSKSCWPSPRPSEMVE